MTKNSKYSSTYSESEKLLHRECSIEMKLNWYAKTFLLTTFSLSLAVLFSVCLQELRWQHLEFSSDLQTRCLWLDYFKVPRNAICSRNLYAIRVRHERSAVYLCFSLLGAIQNFDSGMRIKLYLVYFLCFIDNTLIVSIWTRFFLVVKGA